MQPELTNQEWQELIAELSEPFPSTAVFWRAGAVSRDKKRAQALAYAEPRVYEDRLNTVCPGLWSVTFRPWGETRVICDLTIAGLTRSSTGEFDEDGRGFAQGTVAEAQAFKRACSKFGLGRYLYDLPATWVDYDDAQKRLLEIPSLPGRFLPAAAEGPEAKRSAPTGPAKATPEPGLSRERAQAMARELEKLGFAKAEGRKLAGRVLGREVAGFEQVSEAEALEIWNAAKRETPGRAA